MDTTIILDFLNQWLGVVINSVLLLGFFFLWLSWHGNGKRQKKLENMLSETARQLEEATQHLSQVTEAMKHIKRQELSQSSTRPPQTARTKQPLNKPPPPPTVPSQNSTQATMILRMKREGDSPQTIAERLDMPLAQVNLLLKLHAASSSA